jgi:hypothetical protein
VAISAMICAHVVVVRAVPGAGMPETPISIGFTNHVQPVCSSLTSKNSDTHKSNGQVVPRTLTIAK